MCLIHWGGGVKRPGGKGHGRPGAGDLDPNKAGLGFGLVSAEGRSFADAQCVCEVQGQLTKAQMTQGNEN